MSSESGSGPQLVSAASQRIGECPHWDTGLSLIEDLAPEGIRDAERLRHFAVAKNVSDILADRLPNMTTEYPPYGLPEFYRDPWMQGPGKRPLSRLSYTRSSENTQLEALGALHSAYGTKLIIYLYGELEILQSEPKHAAALEALANEARLPVPGHQPEKSEQAYEILGPPAVDNLDLMIGFMAVAPDVLEAKLGRKPTHTEVVASLSSSQRLTILPTLLARSQFTSFLVGISKNNALARKNGIWLLEPCNFEARSDRKGAMVIDYKDGINGIIVPEYKLDTGEFGDAFVPTVVRGSVDHDQAKKLEDVEEIRKKLTCPSRKLTTAIWKDLINIADAEQIFVPQD